MSKLGAMDRLIQARIELQKEKPFFSFLTMHLTFVDSKDKPDIKVPTMCVDMNGNIIFNEEFVETLNDREVKGVLCHEVMHCALEHLTRLNGRDMEVWNVSTDSIINNILINDGLTLPKGVIMPENNNISLFGKNIDNLPDKSAEEVYDLVWSKIRKDNKGDMQKMKDYINKNKGKNGSFDKHLYGDGKPLSGKKGGKGSGKGKLEIPLDGNKDWKKILVDAATYAKQQGHLPAGMERLIDGLLESSIDWKGLLYRYITNLIPIDYIWTRPSKKSRSLGVYLPSVVKEKIDLVIAVDTSSSISKDELQLFISEITGIIRSFRNVDLTIMDCDSQINTVVTYKDAKIDDVIDFKFRGGGGTSHKPVFNWMNENLPNARLLICFTDGYTSFPNPQDVNVNTLWVVAGYYRADASSFPFGEVIELPKKRD